MQTWRKRIRIAAVAALLACAIGAATEPSFAQTKEPDQGAPAAGAYRPSYVLGPGDELVINARDFDDIPGAPARINEQGELVLPVLGSVKAAGLRVEELEVVLCGKLKEYVKAPQVAVSIARFRPEPVFFVGAFRNPGVHDLQGRTTLLEAITAAGGLLPNASPILKITRRSGSAGAPGFPGAPSGAASAPGGAADSISLDIDAGPLLDGRGFAQEILVKPYDVIRASMGGPLYVVGEVAKAGVLEFNSRPAIEALEAVAMAGGFTPDAAPQKSVVLRLAADSNRRDIIELDLKKLMAGETDNFRLLPNDVLVIPGSKKSGVKRTMLTMIPGVSTSLLVSMLAR